MSLMRAMQSVYGGLGQFTLYNNMLYQTDPVAIQTLFADLLVVSAEPYWEMDRITYRAYSHKFRQVEMGAIVPIYTPTISIAGEPEGTQYYHVSWKEVKD